MLQTFDPASFFSEYGEAASGNDPGRIAAMYDASFVAAGPKGSAAFKNDEAFLDWLHQLHEFKVKTGMGEFSIEGIEESPISPDFTSVTVEWATTFEEKLGDDLIAFEITYILRTSGEAPKIVAYFSHEDQEEVMRERGLL